MLFSVAPWTHFIELIRLDDSLKRAFYELQAMQQPRSTPELKRQLGSLLYERVRPSYERDAVLKLAQGG